MNHFWNTIGDLIPEISVDKKTGTLKSSSFLLKMKNNSVTSAYLIGDSTEDMCWWSDFIDDIVDDLEITHYAPIPK